MSKIIFLDIDGTLVDYENQLPASAVTAIRLARKNGHKVYLCSGRSKAEIYPYLWDIGVDGFIGGNGSYVEDHNTVILHQLITLEQCQRIVDWLHERKLAFYLESNNGLFASEDFEVQGQPVIQQYSKRKGKENAEQLTVRDAFPDMIFGGKLYRDDLNKVSYVLSSYQDYLDARDAFPDLQNGTWGGKDEEALFGDFGVKNVTKANAIEKLLSYLHADFADTIAFGDAKIDIPMLECCAVGVAMGNGGKEIKAMADMITDCVDEDGLYHAFEKLGLIERREKLIFFDIDGTLAMPGNPPSHAVIEAIQSVRRAGHKVFISTGRVLQEVPPEIARIGFDGGIYSAGCYIEAGGSILFEQAMDQKLIHRILSVLSSHHLCFCMESPTGNFAGRNDNSPVLHMDLSNAGNELQRFIYQSFLSRDGKTADTYIDEPIFKITFISPDKETINQLTAELSSYAKVVSFDNLSESIPIIAGEISDYSINKGLAVEAICNYYGINTDDCIAFGDSMNDAEMLQTVGFGIAMGNAEAGVQRFADMICDSCANDGVAKALYDLQLTV